jgi:hypothetical protein
MYKVYNFFSITSIIVLLLLAQKSLEVCMKVEQRKPTERFTDLGKLNFPMVVRF